MNDASLAELLERAADQTPVHPAPVATMLAKRRHRRRATLAVASVAVGVVAIAGGTAALTGSEPDRPGTSAQLPSPSPEVSVPPLAGTWVVTEFLDEDGHNALAPVYEGKVTLTFNHGILRGFTGCNHLTGSYVQSAGDGHDLRFLYGVRKYSMGITLMGCHPDDAPLFSRLADVRTVVPDGETRRFLDSDGNTVLELVPRTAR